MGRFCIVQDLVAELVMAEIVMGRVCHEPSLLLAEMSRNSQIHTVHHNTIRFAQCQKFQNEAENGCE